MPPCESCLHEPICVLKIALKKATTVEATSPPLPEGLSVALSAKVECSFYNPVKKPRGMSNWSPERRAAQAQLMRDAKAAGKVK